MMADSERTHWDRFWSRPRALEDIYDNDGRILAEVRGVVSPEGLLTLEVGAATARDSATLSMAGAVAVALDYSHKALEKASESSGNVLLVCGDAGRLPFRDGVFDLVFHQGVMEHFRDPGPMTSECARVLVPGGRLLVDVPQTLHPYTLLKKLLIAFGAWFAGWETQYTVRGLQRFLARHGLSAEGAYARYFSPSLAYRIVRELLLRAGLKLPLRPVLVPPVHRFRRAVRSRVERSRFGLLTGCVIGVFARKPPQ